MAKADPRQLATGGDLAEQLDQLARIGGDHEFHRSMPSGDRLLWASGRTSMAKRPSGIASSCMLAVAAVPAPGRIALAALAQRLGGLHEGLTGRGQFVFHPLEDAPRPSWRRR